MTTLGVSIVSAATTPTGVRSSARTGR